MVEAVVKGVGAEEGEEPVKNHCAFPFYLPFRRCFGIAGVGLLLCSAVDVAIRLGNGKRRLWTAHYTVIANNEGILD